MCCDDELPSSRSRVDLFDEDVKEARCRCDEEWTSRTMETSRTFGGVFIHDRCDRIQGLRDPDAHLSVRRSDAQWKNGEDNAGIEGMRGDIGHAPLSSEAPRKGRCPRENPSPKFVLPSVEAYFKLARTRYLQKSAPQYQDLGSTCQYSTTWRIFWEQLHCQISRMSPIHRLYDISDCKQRHHGYESKVSAWDNKIQSRLYNPR